MLLVISIKKPPEIKIRQKKNKKRKIFSFRGALLLLQKSFYSPGIAAALTDVRNSFYLSLISNLAIHFHTIHKIYEASKKKKSLLRDLTIGQRKAP